MNYDEWFESLNKNGRTTYFLGQEGKVSKEAWDAGQQSNKKEVDDLKDKLQSILNRVCMLQHSDGERIYKEIKEILNE